MSQTSKKDCDNCCSTIVVTTNVRCEVTIEVEKDYSDALKILVVHQVSLENGETTEFEELAADDEIREILETEKQLTNSNFSLLIRPDKTHNLEKFLKRILAVRATYDYELETGDYKTHMGRILNEWHKKGEEDFIFKVPYGSQFIKYCIIKAIKLENLLFNKIEPSLPPKYDLLKSKTEMCQKIGAIALYHTYKEWAGTRSIEAEQENN